MSFPSATVGAAVCLLVSFSASGQTPGDSVINGRYRGSSGVQFQPVGEGLSVLLDDVNLDSQTDKAYVVYGPFTNTSNVMLTIALVHTGTAALHAVTGIVNGVQRDSDPHRVEFKVLPGDIYHFRALDAARLTVYAERAGLTAPAVGLPVATSFERPTGEFLSCLDVYYYQGDPEDLRPLYNHTLYYYRAGSMSDRSDQEDRSFNPVPQGATTGRKPPQAVTCVQAPPTYYWSTP